MNRKPGDWNCRSCQHLNFSRRDSCQRCGDPRSIGGDHRSVDYASFCSGGGRGGPSFGFSGSDVRPGDWYCQCGAHNFASRSSCFKCNAFKDESAVGGDVATTSLISSLMGDIESMPFIEALGQFPYRVGTGNFCLVHLSLVPVLNVVGEQKTKPVQHSVRGLRGHGLTPNILACRSTKPMDDNVKEKLSQFCHVPAANIVTLYDVSNIWHIPLLLME